ncbi:hypothetical protein H257_00279 [Aphanomyces astaci]|uniref:Uncharacterized protein n=1 Tax=Aphanomyces astaci TaxID=112090 RepID=W4H9T0_APHAT|nr:hypothetical protein H257_00279 [Aphanomyces astaci]ETV88780.1 hypothetical protein H257_00279 [Aphanomyces astaci]|eukprot:XP_009821180.1 hypothetical protein H257_00279 [Aphanomyces astaci]
MGCGQSALKKEIQGLHALETKRAEEIAKLEDERRMLKYKMSVLEDMVATAQLEVHEKVAAAAAAEERMKVMKWELVRQATPPTTPRQSLTWALNDKTTQKLAKMSSARVVSTIPPSKEATQSDTKLLATRAKANVDTPSPHSDPKVTITATTAIANHPKTLVASPIVIKPSTSTGQNESTTVAVVTKKPELIRLNTPRKVIDPSEVNESKDAFEAVKAITTSSSRRTKDSNAIERDNSNIGTRRHSSKSMIRGPSTALSPPSALLLHQDSHDERALSKPLTKPKSAAIQAPLTSAASSKPTLSPKSSRSSIINPSSRETSPTAAASKAPPGFVLAMPLSKGGPDDLPHRKHSKPSPPRPDSKRPDDEPDAEPATGVTAFALDDDDDDCGTAVVCLDDDALGDLM